MEHEEAIRLTATERYLLNELTAEQRDQFEEHFFACAECATDLRAGSQLIEKSKELLADTASKAPSLVPRRVPAPSGWFSWVRPAYAVPVFALLLAVVVYQNAVTVPRMRTALNNPQLLPWTTINTQTRGASSGKVEAQPGRGFALLLNIPPDPGYSSYRADVYNAAGAKEWSLPISTNSSQDTYVVQVPPRDREPGTYHLALIGITNTGQAKEVSRNPFELELEK
jgi:Putative zinc-finger